MSPLVFLLIAAAAGLGLYRTMRGRAEGIRYLEEGAEEAPLAISHLSRSLQRMARDTRALRVSLDDPQRRLHAIRGRLEPDFDASSIEHLLLNTSRDLGEWFGATQRLGEEDRAHLEDVGAHPVMVRDILAAEDFGLELGRGGPKRARQLVAHLQRLKEALLAIERALQIQTDPYR